MRILVIEDYQPLRRSLQRGLEEINYAIDATGDGDEGLWYATSNLYDAIILDLMLPGRNGMDILRTLRQRESTVPVLILTARDSVSDRVQGLDAGADDYLVKPFAFEELLARLRVLIRRGNSQHHQDAVLRIADLEIDTRSRTVKRAGQAITLTAKEYALLEVLAHHHGTVLSREQLREHCYAFDQTANSNVIDVYIGYLRKKLDLDGLTPLIHTRRGMGYALGGEP
jgi:DNA-binding response OmpR family regulator